MTQGHTQPNAGGNAIQMSWANLQPKAYQRVYNGGAPADRRGCSSDSSRHAERPATTNGKGGEQLLPTSGIGACREQHARTIHCLNGRVRPAGTAKSVLEHTLNEGRVHGHH